jgi:hypothetical protein
MDTAPAPRATRRNWRRTAVAAVAAVGVAFAGVAGPLASPAQAAEPSVCQSKIDADIRSAVINGTESTERSLPAKPGDTTGPKMANFDRDAHRVGFHIWNEQIASPAVAEYVEKVKPTALRWQADWDHPFLGQASGRAVPAQNLAAVTNSMPLYTQNNVKIWTSLWANQWGTMRWATGGNNGYPYDIARSYTPWARQVADAMTRNGASPAHRLSPDMVAFSAYNEPDTQNTGVQGFPNTTAAHDYGTTVWLGQEVVNGSTRSVSGRDLATHWTGGLDKFKELHTALDDRPEVTWTSAGIASSFGLWFKKRPGPLWENWYPRVANCEPMTNQPNTEMSDWITQMAAEAQAWKTQNPGKKFIVQLHSYMLDKDRNGNPTAGGPGTMLYQVEAALDLWAKAGLTDVAFFIGETGHTPNEAKVNDLDVAGARSLRSVHYQLIRNYGDRYQGMALLGDNVANYNLDPVTGAWWDPGYQKKGADTVVAELKAPVASMTAPTATTTAARSTFDAAASTAGTGSVTGYEWDFGDGTKATGPSVVKNYAKAGTYTATVTVTNSAGLAATATQTVTVTAAPTTRDAVQITIAETGGPTVALAQRTVSGGNVTLTNQLRNWWWPYFGIVGQTTVPSTTSGAADAAFRIDHQGAWGMGRLTGEYRDAASGVHVRWDQAPYNPRFETVNVNGVLVQRATHAAWGTNVANGKQVLVTVVVTDLGR